MAVAASPSSTWSALCEVDARFSGVLTATAAVVLGCDDRRRTDARPLTDGAAFPGFHVTAIEPPKSLTLEGRHRFATYRLSFHVEPAGPGRCQLTARSYAAFPGLLGAAYRALVIGSGAHVIATTRLLSSIASAAESRNGR